MVLNIVHALKTYIVIDLKTDVFKNKFKRLIISVGKDGFSCYARLLRSENC